MTSLRIAHCIHGLEIGGAQQIIKYLVRGSDRQGFKHYVYSCSDGVFRADIERGGARVRIIPRRLPKLDPGWIAALARTMRADAIDVVHTYLFGDSLHGYLAARLAGAVPVVMSLHTNFRAQSALQQRGYRWLLSRADCTVACSESVRASFRAAGHARSVPIEMIPNGIEAPAVGPIDVAHIRRSLGLDPTALVIGSVGRLAVEKGLTYLIRAFAAVAATRANVFLVLVGEGSLRDELARQAGAAGVGDRVRFVGYRADVTQVLAAFDVFAFSSLSEALPVALLEAMAAARCIVATRAPGIVDAVTEREALLVPVADAGALAEALARALADAPLRTALGRAAAERVRREFTAEGMVRRYEALYREVRASRASTSSARAVRGSVVPPPSAHPECFNVAEDELVEGPLPSAHPEPFDFAQDRLVEGCGRAYRPCPSRE